MQKQRSAELLESEACQEGSTARFVRRNPAWLPSLAVAALAVAFVASGLVPAWRMLKSEFRNYYLAAKLYRHKIPLDRVYECTWFQRQNDHLECGMA